MTINNTNNQYSANLKILFWNARSIIQRRHELSNILNDIDLFICVESWLNSKNEHLINDSRFVQYEKNRTYGHGGGILVLIRKDLAFRELSNIVAPNQNTELCGISLTNITPAIDIIICYRPPGLTFTQAEWDTLIQNIRRDRPGINRRL